MLPQLWPDLKHGLKTMATCSRQQIHSFSTCTPVFSFLSGKMEMWPPIKRPRHICQQKYCRGHCNQAPTLLSLWHNYQTFLKKSGVKLASLFVFSLDLFNFQIKGKGAAVMVIHGAPLLQNTVNSFVVSPAVRVATGDLCSSLRAYPAWLRRPYAKVCYWNFSTDTR